MSILQRKSTSAHEQVNHHYATRQRLYEVLRAFRYLQERIAWPAALEAISNALGNHL
jgi:hypothetical protein